MYALALAVPLDVDDAIAAVYAVVMATSRVSVYALALVNVEASPVVIAVALVAIAVVLVAMSAVLVAMFAVLALILAVKFDPAVESNATFFNVIVLPSWVNTSVPLICRLSRLLFVSKAALGSASCNTVLFPILKAIYISSTTIYGVL